MGLLGKAEYKKMELPFYYIREEEDFDAGVLSKMAFLII